jgi:membrane protein YqaA with SNARE-associated domain
VSFGAYDTTFLTIVSTIVVSIASGLLPFVNAELFVVFLGTVARGPMLPLLLVLATLGHMIGKALLYLAGRGVDRLPAGAFRRRIEAARTRASAHGAVEGTVVLASAAIGFPPFYLVTVAAGVMGFRFLHFFLLGFAGRLLRFGALLFLPPLARALMG